MRRLRRTPREVLDDKRGIATSLADVLAGVSLQTLGIALAGGAILTVAIFYGVSSASASTSSDFQNANVAFQKAVHASDYVEGVGSDSVYLLKNDQYEDGTALCDVQLWHGVTASGTTALKVDSKQFESACSSEPSAFDMSDADSKPLVEGVTTPVFAYANLGDRAVTFDGDSAASLATGVKPAGVKQADWDDLRVYKATLSLTTSNGKVARSTQKMIATGYTDVETVTQAADSLRYVPAPSTDPVPGPLAITGARRSLSTGTVYAGVHEGVRVLFSGGSCPGVLSKVQLSYTMQSPTPAPPVDTVFSQSNDGGLVSVDLGQVPNGSSGKIDVKVSCTDGGVVEEQSINYVQDVPAPTLTVTQNATAAEKHELSWNKVSSLSTSFALGKALVTAGSTAPAAGAYAQMSQLTDQYSYESVAAPGANLGMTTYYSLVATVDDNSSPKAVAQITNPLAQPAATAVTSSSTGASWNATSCPAYSTPRYASHYYQQTGTNTAVSWSALTPWSQDLSFSGVVTPGYGRTVTEVQSRCVATVSSGVSAVTTQSDAYYMPETINVGASRSAVAGTVYQGVHEGVQALYSAARCWNGTPTTVWMDWVSAVGGQPELTGSATNALSGGTYGIDLAGVANGSSGTLSGSASCAGVRSGSTSAVTGFTQGVPAPTLSVAQGSSPDQHVVSWTPVSSLSTYFQVSKSAAAGSQNTSPPATNATSEAITYAAGTNQANPTNYSVTATINGMSATSNTASITTPWGPIPQARSITYTPSGNGPNGTVSWSYGSSCPAGTTLSAHTIANRTGQSDGSISTTVKKSGDWSANLTSERWQPSYALYGYAYGIAVDANCTSNVTGFVSGTTDIQSGNWVLPMPTPAAPVWDAYNFHDGTSKRPTSRTYTTCKTGGCPSMEVDYDTSCTDGASVNWSTFNSKDWTGATFSHSFGWQDYWQLGGTASQTVVYGSAKYSCATPWATSPQSPAGAAKNLTVEQPWW